MAATGADPSEQAGAAALRQAFASLDLLVITLITPETERVLPAAEMPGLRAEMNDALLELVYDDPLNAWGDVPVLELSGALHGRLDTVLAAVDLSRQPRPPGPNAQIIDDRALAPLEADVAGLLCRSRGTCCQARWALVPAVDLASCEHLTLP